MHMLNTQMHYAVGTPTAGGWNDGVCTTPRAYVCEMAMLAEVTQLSQCQLPVPGLVPIAPSTTTGVRMLKCVCIPKMRMLLVQMLIHRLRIVFPLPSQLS